MILRQRPDRRLWKKIVAFQLEKNLVIFIHNITKIPCVFCQNVIVEITTMGAAVFFQPF
jgi:hypothetical protein